MSIPTTPDDVRAAVVEALRAGDKQVAIALRFGVSQSMVSKIAVQKHLTRRAARLYDQERHCHICGKHFVWTRQQQITHRCHRKHGRKESELITCGSVPCSRESAAITKRKHAERTSAEGGK